jgi:hypothetical protein
VDYRALRLAKSLTEQHLLHQTKFGEGPDECQVSPAFFGCIMQPSLWIFLSSLRKHMIRVIGLAMFLC